jgi:hypothetical protein
MLWMLDDLKPEEERLRKYLKGHLIRRDGGWRLSYDRSVTWAVLWWVKEGQCG